MIKLEKTDVFGFESAIRGMRNPFNSWKLSDSEFSIENSVKDGRFKQSVELGANDLKLMRCLAKSGDDHGKFLRMINVTVDITAPLYWWKEHDQYKVGTTTNSCSTMHRLLSKPFEMSDFSFDKLPGYKKDIKYFIPDVDETKEEWRNTVQDEYYLVSNEGRVKHDGRLLSGSIHKDGYIFVNIRGKKYAKHRVVAEAFIPNPDNKPYVNHIDGNKQNNKVENLEWCTQSENIIHAYANGLQPQVLSTYKGKFDCEQREEIKQLWDSGMFSRRQLAEKFGVSHTCINDIINDKYKYAEKTNVYEEVARPLVDTLNELRDAWFTCEDEQDKKTIWYSIIQLLPTSYNQKRTVQLNYQVLKSMYFARKNHKLDEWREFCKWCETLPYFKDIVIQE